MIDRLKEPSTWAAISAVAFHLPLPPWCWIVGGTAALAGILLREKGAAP